MENWLKSIYSDGSINFVSNPLPKLGETVQVMIRMYEDAPVKHVLLRTVPDGAERLLEMKKVSTENGLAYYQTELLMSNQTMQYQFYIVCMDTIYYYTQREITTYIPDHTYDFKILCDYEQPTWVKESVFYQIFPERFCNGNPDNDVQTDEYEVNGYKTIKVSDWNEKVYTYEQGHCLDFYGGDLEGIKEKIPYLKKLGVDAIYLNPIFLAPSNHKYDCIDYFTVDPHFGGNEAFAELMEALHKNEMRLILDVSINHTGISHKWFKEHKEYYFFDEKTGEYACWAGVKGLATLNYTSKKLKEVIYEGTDSLVKKWLKPPYNIDGWRFDVADVMARNGSHQLQHEIWPKIRQSIKEVNKEAFILAEDWGDCSTYLQGNEWDAPMNYYGFGRIIRQFLGEPDLFNQRNELLKNVPYKMTAQDVANRITQHLAKLPHVIRENQFNLFDSHDVPRLHNNPAISDGDYALAVIMLFTMPGTASIYYGDEAEIGGRVEDNEGCRATMPWKKDIESTESYRMYHKLIELKRNEKALIDGGFKILCSEGYLFAYARFTKNQTYIVICSTESESKTISIPLPLFGKKHFDKKQDVLGSVLEYDVTASGDMQISVHPHMGYLFEL